MCANKDLVDSRWKECLSEEGIQSSNNKPQTKQNIQKKNIPSLQKNKKIGSIWLLVLFNEDSNNNKHDQVSLQVESTEAPSRKNNY